jgi:hypothetical protein
VPVEEEEEWNFIDDNEISLDTRDLILHFVWLPSIGYTVNLMMA